MKFLLSQDLPENVPKIDDLEPIVDSRQTFSETPFIRDFYKLDNLWSDKK